MPVTNAPHLDLEWMTEGLPEEDARDIMCVCIVVDNGSHLVGKS
jgi:hypothetical protein